MATFDPKKLGCEENDFYRFGLLEILEKELRRPSIEFQQELEKIGDDPDIKKYLGIILGSDKFRGLTSQVIEADRKKPKKDKKEEFEGNSSGKLEVAEITESMVQTANFAMNAASNLGLYEKKSESKKCMMMSFFDQSEEALTKYFPSLKGKLKTASEVDLSPLFLNPKDPAQGALFPELGKFPSLPPEIRTVEQLKEHEKKEHLLESRNISPLLRQLLLEDPELFKAYRLASEYIYKTNGYHKNDRGEAVYSDTRLDRAEVEQLAKRDLETPLQYLAKTREEISQLVVTAYLVRQRLGLIKPEEKNRLQISFLKALSAQSPRLFEEDPILKDLRRVLSQERQEGKIREEFEDGALTKEEFMKVAATLPGLADLAKRRALWKTGLKRQEEILQPYHLWPGEIKQRVLGFSQKEQQVLNRLEIGESHRRTAKIMKWLELAHLKKYQERLCRVGNQCGDDPKGKERKEEIWQEVLKHSRHSEEFKEDLGEDSSFWDKIYGPIESSSKNAIARLPYLYTDLSYEKGSEERSGEEHRAVELFLKIFRENPDDTVEDAIKRLQEKDPQTLKVLNEKLYLQTPVNASKLPEQEFNKKYLEAAHNFRIGIGTEVDPGRSQADPVKIEGEPVKGRNLQTYFADAILEGLTASFPEGAAIAKGSAIAPLLDQLDPADKEWFLKEERSIKFGGGRFDIDGFYERIGKYVGFKRWLEEDVYPRAKADKDSKAEVNEESLLYGLYLSTQRGFTYREDLVEGKLFDFSKMRTDLLREIERSKQGKKEKEKIKLQEKEAHQKLTTEGYTILIRHLLALSEEAGRNSINEKTNTIENQVFKDKEREYQRFMQLALSEKPTEEKKEELPTFAVTLQGNKILRDYLEYVGRVQAHPPQPKPTVSRLVGNTKDNLICPSRKNVEGLTGFGALLEVGFPDVADRKEVERLLNNQISDQARKGGAVKSGTASLFPDFREEQAPKQSKEEERTLYVQYIHASKLTKENQEKLITLYDNMVKTEASILAKQELDRLRGHREYNIDANAGLEMANLTSDTVGSVEGTIFNGLIKRVAGPAIYGFPAIVGGAFAGWAPFAIPPWVKKHFLKQAVEKTIPKAKTAWTFRLAAGAAMLFLTVAEKLPFKMGQEVKRLGCDAMVKPIPPWSDEVRTHAYQESITIFLAATIAYEGAGFAFKWGKFALDRGWMGFKKRLGTAWGSSIAFFTGGIEKRKKYLKDHLIEGKWGWNWLTMGGKKSLREIQRAEARAKYPEVVWLDEVLKETHQKIDSEFGKAVKKLKGLEEELKKLRGGFKPGMSNQAKNDLMTDIESTEEELFMVQREVNKLVQKLRNARHVGAVGKEYYLSEVASDKIRPGYERRKELEKQIAEAEKELPEIRRKLEDNYQKWRNKYPHLNDFSKPPPLMSEEGKGEWNHFKNVADEWRPKEQQYKDQLAAAKKELADKKEEWDRLEETALSEAVKKMHEEQAKALQGTKFTSVLMWKGPIAYQMYDGIKTFISNKTSWTYETILRPIGNKIDHWLLPSSVKEQVKVAKETMKGQEQGEPQEE